MATREHALESMSPAERKALQEQLRRIDGHASAGYVVAGSAPARPSAAAPDTIEMVEASRAYAALKPFERARLLNTDPPRHKRLRTAYERHVKELHEARAKASTFAERQDVQRALAKLENLNRDDEGPSAA